MPDMRTSVGRRHSLTRATENEPLRRLRALEQAREHGYRPIERRADAVLERFEIEVSERA
jgi:hypothetical protein